MTSKYLKLSLLLHLILIALLLMPKGCGKGNGNGDGDKTEQSEQSKNKPEKDVDLTEHGEGEEKPKEKNIEVSIITHEELEAIKAKCPDDKWYGGIGVTIAFDPITKDLIVVETPEYYPAYKAGIRAGDRVMNNNEIRGEVGSKVTVIIERNFDILQFTIVRAKICYK